MQMSIEEYHEHCNDSAGYCKSCDEVTTYCVEPDVNGYECEACGELEVMGVEQALLEGEIELS